MGTIGQEDDLSQAGAATPPLGDNPINPLHYKSHPTSIECIQITRWLSFNLGNAIKYIWRTAFPGTPLPDTEKIKNLEKAIWYLQDEKARIRGKHDHTNSGSEDQ